MPSKEICEVKLSTTANVDYLSYGVDDLITEIKDNLRLKSHKPSRSHLSLKRRSSPYTLPTHSRSSCDCSGHSSSKCMHNYTKAQKDNQDPFQLLQELLREGSLVKEAVRRLEMGLSPKTRIFYDDSDGVEDCNSSWELWISRFNQFIIHGLLRKSF